MPQPPKPPDKPLMPYVRYNKKMWDKLRGDGNSELKLWDISRMIGSKWREMSDEDKQVNADTPFAIDNKYSIPITTTCLLCNYYAKYCMNFQ